MTELNEQTNNKNESIEEYNTILNSIKDSMETQKEKIKRLAKILDESGYPKEKICAKVSNDVEKFGIDNRYVRKNLPDEYKGKTKAAPRPSLKEEQLVVSNDGSQTIESASANVNKEQNLGAQMSKIDDNNVIVETSIKESKEVAASKEEIIISKDDFLEEDLQSITLCNHEPYIKDLENQIIELKKQLEIKDKEIAELKKPKIQPSSPNYSLFSSKTHEDYNRTKYMLKK